MKRLKHIVMVIAAVVSVALPLASTLNLQTVYAAPEGVVDSTKSALYATAYAYCLQYTKDNIDASEVAKRNIFNDSRVYVGILLDSNDDGIRNCAGSDSAWIDDAFSLWGFNNDPLTAACSLNWSADNNPYGNIDDCTSSTGKLQASNNKGTFYDRLAMAVYSRNSTSPPPMSDAMKYYWNFQSFVLGCGSGSFKDDGLYSKANASLKSQVDNASGGDNIFKLMMDDGGGNMAMHIVETQKDRNDNIHMGVVEGDSDYKPECITIAQSANQTAKAYGTYVTKTGDGGGSSAVGSITDGNESIDTTCGDSDTNFVLKLINPLNWLTCPLIAGMSTAAKMLDNGIVSMLCINEGSIFGGASTCGENTGGGNTSDAYKQAWNVFRILAVGLLVVAGLIMVLSQAAGMEIFDAYTIRKVFPRLLIAMIAITLSWQLMEFFVGLSNALGIGVRSLIYAPFTHAGIDTVTLKGGAKAVATLLSLSALAALGALGILSFLATALLAILIAFFVLVVRNILVILLIIFAPIALAAYVLPNTQKIWSAWWDWFTKALMVFPIITAFIAVGHVFAAITTAQASAASGVGATIASFAGFFAYFAPYLLLPLTFRFAGGALGTIGGFVNDRGRGGFDRLRKYRGQKAAENFTRLQNNQRWDPNSRMGKVGNTIGTWATSPASNAAYKGRNIRGLRKAGQKVAGQIEGARMEQSGKLFEELNKAGYNDRAYRALSGVHDGLDENTQTALSEANLLNKAPASITEIQKMAKILSNSEIDTERIGGNAIQASAGRLATLYQDPEMGKASVAAAGIMGLSAHGFADGKDLEAAGNVLQGEKGEDVGFAQSVVSQAQLMGMRSRPDVKPGYGVVYKDGKFVDGMSAKGGRAQGLLKTLNSQDLASAKGGAITKLEPHIVELLGSGGDAARAQKDQLFQWAGQYSVASVGVKAESLRIIRENGLEAEFNAVANRQLSPEEIARMQGGGGDPGQQPGGPAQPGGQQ